MFGNLDREPAAQLLLKAADKPAPWDSPTQEMASIITKLLYVFENSHSPESAQL